MHTRITGAAALGYVIAAGVEAAHAGDRFAAPTAGALSLALYAVFVAGMTARVRGPRPAVRVRGPRPAVRERGPRPAVRERGPLPAASGRCARADGLVAPALAGGLVAAALAAVALAASFDPARLAAGPFMALFMVAAAGALPPALSRAAVALAAPLALAPVMGDAAVVAFSAQALWVGAAGLWLVLGPGDLVRRGAFLVLVLAAGLIGAALLIAPGATGSFFSWGLGPEPLATFAGGVYLASAVVYAAGLRERDARSLVAGAAALSVSVLAATLVHLDAFDLGRLEAWAWLVLFAAFAVTMTALLARPLDGGGPALAPWARAALAIVAAALGTVAAALWIEPAGHGLSPLGGRFAGSWALMLAVVAAWAAARNRRDEARLPALALVALPAGALAAALRTTDQPDVAYLGGLALVAGVGLAVLAWMRAPEVELRSPVGSRAWTSTPSSSGCSAACWRSSARPLTPTR